MRLPRLFALGLVIALLLAPIVAYSQDFAPRNVAASQFTVTTTPALTAQARSTRQAVTIQNLGATAVYCGASSAVTTANGFRLPGVDGASVTIPTTAALWCLVGAGTQAVAILESY